MVSKYFISTIPCQHLPQYCNCFVLGTTLHANFLLSQILSKQRQPLLLSIRCVFLTVCLSHLSFAPRFIYHQVFIYPLSLSAFICHMCLPLFCLSTFISLSFSSFINSSVLPSGNLSCSFKIDFLSPPPHPTYFYKAIALIQIHHLLLSNLFTSLSILVCYILLSTMFKQAFTG